MPEKLLSKTLQERNVTRAVSAKQNGRVGCEIQLTQLSLGCTPSDRGHLRK